MVENLGLMKKGNPGPYLWPALFSTPQSGLLNKTFFVPIGSVVGGGSAVNAMFFHRGSVEDFDGWETLGNPGWEWEGLLPYFKKSENFTAPDEGFARAHNVSWEDGVHGVEGLAVADASVFPTLSGGHTNAPSIMVGWRAGEFLRAGA